MVPRTTVLKSSRSRQPAGSARLGALFDGRYLILRLLGEGGMGAVFLAEHAVLGRQVAIKFLHPDHAAQEGMVGRFHREAQAAAATRHRNIIDIFDVGVSPQGEPFLVMEYLEGESLAQLLKRAGPLNLSASCAVVEQALLGLAAAHRTGIIHRDLKPDNLFLAYPPNQPPVVKIIDFGISKFTQGQYDKWRTKTGSLLGTPAYMSPEQARALPGLDHRSDLYAMGTILYEMLTGALPFAGSSFTEFLSNLLIEQPRPPRTLRPDFPVEAEPILAKALAKDPGARFQTAEEMLDSLRQLKSFHERLDRLGMLASTIEVRGYAAGDLGEIPSGNERRDDVRAGRPWWDASLPPASRPKRRIAMLGAGIAVLAGGLATGGLWLSRRGYSPPPAPPAMQAAPAPPVAPAPALAPAPVARPEVFPPAANPAAKEPQAKETAAGLGRSESRGKPFGVASRGKPRAKPAPPAGATSPPADVPAQKDRSTGLRTGARGTKISDSFE